jgi:hypothetical protein
VHYAFVWMSVTPGLGFWHAMVMTQATTAVANTVPAGSAIGIGMTYTMLGSWGYSRSRSTTAVLVSGVWNSFIKLGLPVLALVLLQGGAGGGRVTAALLGIAGLVAAVVVFTLLLRSEDQARRFGLLAARVATRLRRLIGRGRWPVGSAGLPGPDRDLADPGRRRLLSVVATAHDPTSTPHGRRPTRGRPATVAASGDRPDMQTSTGRGRDRDRARVRHLAMGGVDLQRDLNAGNGNQHTLYVRSHLVVVSRAAGIEPPVDAVWPYLGDEAGLREQAEFARLLGFSGKSAIHPRQLPVLHEVFTPSRRELAWARQVVDAFDAAGGEALRLPTVSSSTCPSRSGPGACSS